MSQVCPQGCPRVFSGFPQGSAATCRLHVVLTASDIRRWLHRRCRCVASTVAVVWRGHPCVTIDCVPIPASAPVLAETARRRPNYTKADSDPAPWARMRSRSWRLRTGRSGVGVRTRARSLCWQPGPTGHGSPSPVPSASRRVRAGFARRGSCAARQGVLELSMLALHTLEAPQLWSWSWRLGPGCSGVRTSPAWLHRSWPAKPCLIRVALRASCPCAARC